MKSKLALSVVLFSIVGISITNELTRIRYQAREAAKRSAALGLIAEVERVANIYFDEHGTYPSVLDEIEIAAFPDGGDAKLLEEIVYRIDGESISLSWRDTSWTKTRNESR